MIGAFSLARVTAILRKEFTQMRRDRLTFAMMIGVPMMQLLLFGFAINTDPRHLPTMVELRDDGPGFPPEMANVAFDRFSRGDEARARDGAGAGLGLAIAHHIATGHDGDLTLLEGPGGALRLRLPSA